MTKVLVVEDDRHTRSALIEVLRAEAFEVDDADNGNKAIDKFQSFKPDLVCLDVMLPGVSGYDLCRRFRAERMKYCGCRGS